jgi:hypothetical protein
MLIIKVKISILISMRSFVRNRARKVPQPGTQRFRWVAGWVDNYRDAMTVVRLLKRNNAFLLVKREGCDPLHAIYVEADVVDERNAGVLTGIVQGVIATVQYSTPFDHLPWIPKTRETKSLKNLYRKSIAKPRRKTLSLGRRQPC